MFPPIPKLGTGGRGSSKFKFFPNSKKSKSSYRRGGGGQENGGLFPLFVTFFFPMGPGVYILSPNLISFRKNFTIEVGKNQ